MQHKLRFLSLILLCSLCMEVRAQSWTASAPAEGTFYLYNVVNEGFMRGANDWSTRASITKEGGIPVTLVSGSNANEFFISTSPTYTDLYLGADGYVDKGSSDENYTAWKFIAVENTENTYYLQAVNTSKYLVGHASDITKTSVVDALLGNNKDYWKLATKEAILDKFTNATEDSPIDATFLILDPYFGRVTNASGVWSGSSFSLNGYASGGTQNFCAECYNKTFDVYQEISGVPNGVYGIKCQGFYRIGGRTDATNRRNNGEEVLNAKYYINGSEGGLMSIFDGSYAKSYTSNYNENSAYTVNGEARYLPNTMSQAANCMRKGDYQNDVVKAIVTDGTIRLGVKKTVAVGNDWSIFDNFVLTYYGIDLSALVEQYNTLLNTAKSLQTEVMQPSAKSALEAAITTAETNVNTDSQEWLENALSTLSTAVSNAQTSNALYTNNILNAVNCVKAQSQDEGVKSEIQNRYDTSTFESAEEVLSVYQTLEIATLSANLADGTDFSSVIINPGFEYDQLGWTGAPAINGTATKCAEKWNSTFDVYQELAGLPNGRYQMTLQCLYRYGDPAPAAAAREASATGVEPLLAKYYINNTEAPLMSIFDNDRCLTNNSTYNTSTAVSVNGTDYYVPNNMDRAAACFAEGDYMNTAIEVTVTNGTVRLGVAKGIGNQNDWAIWDNVQLTYVGEFTPQVAYFDQNITLNIENDVVRDYLANTTYTEASTSVISNYDLDFTARHYQPATTTIYLPEQTTDATLSVSLNSNYSEAMTHTIPAGNIAYEVANLLPNQKYYFKVDAGGATVASGTIATEGNLRMIKADGISNMRDLGGWLTAGNKRLNYGKIYRGSELVGGTNYSASAADLVMLKEDLGIAAEIDLREDVDMADGQGLSASGVEGAAYYYANLNRWSEDALRRDDKNVVFKNAFNLTLSTLQNGGAVYFHCVWGADRTGCYGMLLEGLLGLPVDQMYKDYELTSFSRAGLRAKTGIDSKLNYIKMLPGNNLQEQFFNYWQSIGISQADLRAFIDIMGGDEVATMSDFDAETCRTLADGQYYIYFPTLNKFMSRGLNYATRCVPDDFGVPATISMNAAGIYTIQYLDNNLYLGSDSYTDKDVNYSSISWKIEPNGENIMLKSANGSYLRIFTDESGTRAQINAATPADATPVVFKSATERKSIVVTAQEANILAAASAAGITATDVDELSTILTNDYTDVSSAVSIRVDGDYKNSWSITDNPRSEDGSCNSGDYGAEIYSRPGTLSQTFTVPHPGLYKLTLNAFYRACETNNHYAWGQKGYDLSNAYISVNDTYISQIPDWFTDATSSDYPLWVDQAKALMDDGKYQMGVLAYVPGNELTVKIVIPGYVERSWCLFNNFALTEYAKKVTISETATDVPVAQDFAAVTLERTLSPDIYNTFSVPFDLSADQITASGLNGAAIYEFGSSADNTITFSQTNAIEAGKPYLVKLPETATEPVVNPSFVGVDVKATGGLAIGEAGGIQFVGQIYNKSLANISNVCYITTSGQVKKLSATGSIKGLRAYLIVPPTTQDVKFLFDDTYITGIEDTNLDASLRGEESNTLYDLQGRRVMNPTKGIYIVNGKKVMVK